MEGQGHLEPAGDHDQQRIVTVGLSQGQALEVLVGRGQCDLALSGIEAIRWEQG